MNLHAVFPPHLLRLLLQLPLAAPDKNETAATCGVDISEARAKTTVRAGDERCPLISHRNPSWNESRDYE